MMSDKKFGKYRGIVIDNNDPQMMGRLRVNAPAVHGDNNNNWAMPCVPYAGPSVGFFMLPPTGAKVWVEFEGGDTDYPIWSGCFWGLGEVPSVPPLATKKLIKTDTGTITIDDTPGAGGITIEISGGQKISISPFGLIEIDNGQGAKISLNGPTVSVNQGALEVT